MRKRESQKIPKNFRLSPEVVKKLSQTKEKTGLTETKILERALILFFSKKEAA